MLAIVGSAVAVVFACSEGFPNMYFSPRTLGIALLGMCLMGCGVDMDAVTDGGNSTTSVTTSTNTSGPITEDSTTDASTTEELCPIICESDFGPPLPECSTYEENCEDGEKCMPYSWSHGPVWDSLKCSPVTGDGHSGDPCTLAGGVLTGEDDCALHHMCWNIDPETNMGHCVSFCDGTPDNPTCAEPDTGCFMANAGVLNLCLPNCQPLIQDCPEGEGCYRVGDIFTCLPTVVSEGAGFEGDVCHWGNACQPGFICMNADDLPSCEMAATCCTPFCDLSEQDPCPNPEAECIAVHEDNESNPKVGYCGVLP